MFRTYTSYASLASIALSVIPLATIGIFIAVSASSPV
jgi:hypothetical protein